MIVFGAKKCVPHTCVDGLWDPFFQEKTNTLAPFEKNYGLEKPYGSPKVQVLAMACSTFYSQKHFLVKKIGLGGKHAAGNQAGHAQHISDLLQEKKRLKKTIKKLKEEVVSDSLTGLYNRKHLFEVLGKELDRCRRYGSNLALLVMDVDQFKSVNDQYGHLFGDFVLKKMASILAGCLRDSDVISRYGGDEFVVLLPHTYYDGAVQCAEKINKKVRDAQFTHQRASTTLTVSLGISSFGVDQPQDSDQFLQFADQALARIKTLGGGSHACYKDLYDGNGAGLEHNHQAQDFLGEAMGNLQATSILLKALETRDTCSKRHSVNVMRHAVDLAQQLGLTKAEIEMVKIASLVHDIGKIGISDSILLKKSTLNAQERAAIEKHPVIGSSMLRHLSELRGLQPVILHHHEWENGKGYPGGLQGADIPFMCKIIAVADAYDAMTSQRPYRKRLSFEKMLSEFVKGSGVQFCSQVVRGLFAMLKSRAGPEKKAALRFASSLL